MSSHSSNTHNGDLFSGKIFINPKLRYPSETLLSFDYYPTGGLLNHTGLVLRSTLDSKSFSVDFNYGREPETFDCYQLKTPLADGQYQAGGWFIRVDETKWLPPSGFRKSPYRMKFEDLIEYLLCISAKFGPYQELMNNCTVWTQTVVKGLGGTFDQFTERELIWGIPLLGLFMLLK